MPTSDAPSSSRHRSASLLAAVVALLLTACTSQGTHLPQPGVQPASPSGSASPSEHVASDTTTQSATQKLLVIIEENRSTADVEAHMPYLSAAATRYGHTTQYYALAHPSLPNYLVIAGGSLFGVTDDDDPAAHPLIGPSVFGQLLAAGRTVKTYAEAMPGTCTTHNQGRYAVRHNPWTYFIDPAERTACAKYNVPAGTTTSGHLVSDASAGRLPTFSLVIPDICNDGHDCSAATADHWLHTWLPMIEAGPDFTSGHLTIIVTWDEDDGTDHNRIACIAIQPSLNGRSVDTKLDHYSLSAAISGLGGQQPLRDASGAPDLLHALGLT